jgi:hypothetical protein
MRIVAIRSRATGSAPGLVVAEISGFPLPAVDILWDHQLVCTDVDQRLEASLDMLLVIGVA